MPAGPCCDDAESMDQRYPHSRGSAIQHRTKAPPHRSYWKIPRGSSHPRISNRSWPVAPSSLPVFTEPPKPIDLNFSAFFTRNTRKNKTKLTVVPCYDGNLRQSRLLGETGSRAEMPIIVHGGPHLGNALPSITWLSTETRRHSPRRTHTVGRRPCVNGPAVISLTRVIPVHRARRPHPSPRYPEPQPDRPWHEDRRPIGHIGAGRIQQHRRAQQQVLCQFDIDSASTGDEESHIIMAGVVSIDHRKPRPPCRYGMTCGSAGGLMV